MKPYGRMGLKIYTNELGHMTKMATVMVKTFRKLLLHNQLTDGLGT